jgi:hypothetical protein
MPWYLGLANTCHDPAVAVVSPDGDAWFLPRLWSGIFKRSGPGTCPRIIGDG